MKLRFWLGVQMSHIYMHCTLYCILLLLNCRYIAGTHCTDHCLSFISWNPIIGWFNNTFLKALPLVRKWFSFNKPSVHWVFFMLNWWLTHSDWAQNLIICLPFCFNKLLIVTVLISLRSRTRSWQGCDMLGITIAVYFEVNRWILFL